MTAQTSRLVPAPDDSSVANVGVSGRQTTWNGPAVVLVLVTPGAGPGRHTTPTKVPTMAKSTRGSDPVDRVTRISGVKITPPTLAAPVPSTLTIA